MEFIIKDFEEKRVRKMVALKSCMQAITSVNK